VNVEQIRTDVVIETVECGHDCDQPTVLMRHYEPCCQHHSASTTCDLELSGQHNNNNSYNKSNVIWQEAESQLVSIRQMAALQLHVWLGKGEVRSTNLPSSLGQGWTPI